VTECEIHTLDIEPPHRVQLSLGDGDRFPARIVISSDALKSGIDELEWGGDPNKEKRVTLRVGTHHQALSLTVSSTDVGCEMVYPVVRRCAHAGSPPAAEPLPNPSRRAPSDANH
jgi:hypothetical protein